MPTINNRGMFYMFINCSLQGITHKVHGMPPAVGASSPTTSDLAVRVLWQRFVQVLPALKGEAVDARKRRTWNCAGDVWVRTGFSPEPRISPGMAATCSTVAGC